MNAAIKVHGFNESHVGVLCSADVSQKLNALLAGGARSVVDPRPGLS